MRGRGIFASNYAGKDGNAALDQGDSGEMKRRVEGHLFSLTGYAMENRMAYTMRLVNGSTPSMTDKAVALMGEGARNAIVELVPHLEELADLLKIPREDFTENGRLVLGELLALLVENLAELVQFAFEVS